MSGSSLVFGGGVPTKLDVARLRKEFTELKVGDFIPYNEIADCIEVSRDSNRFRTVVHAWRREIYRELNIVLVPVPSKGFEVASPSERVHLSATKYKSGLRATLRAGDISIRTDTAGLSENEVRARDHIINASAQLRLAAATAAKSLRLQLGKTDKK